MAKSELAKRFEKFFSKTSGCWLWRGAKYPNDYGAFKLDGKPRGAHRVSWIIYCGPIPNGLHVLHKCDVPQCVNPRHLFLGTNDDNRRDMMAKGRGSGPRIGRRGELCPTSKLTTNQVLKIRKDTRSNFLLAKKYGVSFGQISKIKRRERWSHI